MDCVRCTKAGYGECGQKMSAQQYKARFTPIRRTPKIEKPSLEAILPKIVKKLNLHEEQEAIVVNSLLSELRIYTENTRRERNQYPFEEAFNEEVSGDAANLNEAIGPTEPMGDIRSFLQTETVAADHPPTEHQFQSSSQDPKNGWIPFTHLKTVTSTNEHLAQALENSNINKTDLASTIEVKLPYVLLQQVLLKWEDVYQIYWDMDEELSAITAVAAGYCVAPLGSQMITLDPQIMDRYLINGNPY